MKKIIIGLVSMCAISQINAQTNPFPTVDSLVRFINKYIRNSAVDAFTNLRLNTALQGTVRFADSALNFAAHGVDTIYRTPGKDSIIFRINGVRYAVKDSTGGSGVDTTGVEHRANKNAANGYAGLNGSSKVAYAQLDTNHTTGLVAWPGLLAQGYGGGGISDTTGLMRKANNLSDLSSASSARTNLGLGTAATKDVAASGDASATQVVKGNDGRLSDSRAPNGAAGGDLAGTFPNPTVPGLSGKAAVFTSWPAETAYGLIFQSSRFLDTFDFDKHGPISLVRNGNYLDMTNGSVTTPFPNYVTIGEPHLLSNWTFEDTVKLTGALSSSTYGQFKPGLHSINTSSSLPIDVFLTLPTTDAGVNNIYLYRGNSLTPLNASPTTITYSQNDRFSYKLTLKDSVLTGTVKNLTVGGADSAVVTYTYVSANGAPQFKPNTSQFAFYGIGATGTEQLQGMRIYSDEVKNANIMCLGPSRTTPYFSDYWAHGFPRLLNNVYPTVITHGGGADGIVEIARTLNDVKRSNPRIVILNDLLANTRRGGGNVAAGLITYDSIVNVLTEAGITVLHFNIPEDSTAGHDGIGMTDVDAAIRAKYASTYIYIWDSIGQGTNKMAAIYQDPTSGSLGVHLNTAGQAKVAQGLIASGKLTAGLNRIGQSNNSDYYITASKGKVELSPFTVNLLNKMRANVTSSSGGVSMSSNTTNNYTISTTTNVIGDGYLSQDGSKVSSTKPFETDGYIWSRGSASAYSLSNQSTGAQSWLIRSTGTQLLVCDAYNSYNAIMRFDTGASSGMYLPGVGQSMNIGTGSISAGYNLNVNGNAIITPAGGSVAVGPTGSIPSSIFTVTSTSKGVLLPSMNTTQRNAIVSPATGLIIYNTDTNTFQYYNVSSWQDLGSGSLSLAAVGSSPNANAATYSSNTLTLQPASSSFPGVVTTSSQAFAGVKTFNSLPIVGTASAHDSSANAASTGYVDKAVGRLQATLDTAVVRTRIITTTDNTPVNVDTVFVGSGSVLYDFTLYAFANSNRTDGTAGTYSSHIEHSMNYNGTALSDGFDMRFMDFVTGGISSYTGLAFIVSGNYGILQFTGQTGKTIQTTLKYGFENLNSFAP